MTWTKIHTLAQNTERHARTRDPWARWVWPMLVGWMAGVVTVLVWLEAAMRGG